MLQTAASTSATRRGIASPGPRYFLSFEVARRIDEFDPPDQTTLDAGGRCKLARGFIALFMVGRSISGTANGQPEFFGYFDIQILLSGYGRSFAAER